MSKNIMTLKSQSGLLKVVPYDRLGMVSYIVFSSHFVTVFEIFDL